MPAPFSQVLAAMRRIAPLSLAASWDNVGLIVEPLEVRPIARLALVIDLTGAALDEVIERGADCVIAYHPPLFNGLKRLRGSDPDERVLLRCLDAGLPVYAPHTALDAAPGGMNDWLLDGLGPMDRRAAIEPAASGIVPDGVVAGIGRLGALTDAAPLHELIRRVKAWLDLDHVRVAAPEEHAAGQPLRRIAVCPGAGGGVFGSLKRPVDVLLTGELRHHEVLGYVARGTSVILTDHTHTERGYLSVLAARLMDELPGVEAFPIRRDRDPLVVR